MNRTGSSLRSSVRSAVVWQTELSKYCDVAWPPRGLNSQEHHSQQPLLVLPLVDRMYSILRAVFRLIYPRPRGGV